jgi:hypothetical protein
MLSLQSNTVQDQAKKIPDLTKFALKDILQKYDPMMKGNDTLEARL